MVKKLDIKLQKVIEKFTQLFDLSEKELNKFIKYSQMLIEWNNKFNITAITDELEIIAYHFRDSLALGKQVDLNQAKFICDVGSGGGFPAIPLKIKYPHLKVLLIEVNKKRCSFLEEIIKELELENIEIYDQDWRTFLKKSNYEHIDYFVSRASLHPEELVRMFKPSSPYKNSTLVYWAARTWEPEKKEAPLVQKMVEYKINYKRRKLVYFVLSNVQK
ncbi:MAG: Ribosomal RNA small subunit methyltransferase G [candidate division TM6 bacterium GW2011_GWF2_32_72]|nr:MAG: Ribosomal RNA small subunit methyltransferase G [candidate division TM6 bacterium GW2011_GWF2_32_72]